MLPRTLLPLRSLLLNHRLPLVLPHLAVLRRGNVRREGDLEAGLTRFRELEGAGEGEDGGTVLANFDGEDLVGTTSTEGSDEEDERGGGRGGGEEVALRVEGGREAGIREGEGERGRMEEGGKEERGELEYRVEAKRLKNETNLHGMKRVLWFHTVGSCYESLSQDLTSKETSVS